MLWWRSPSKMILIGFLVTAVGIALVFFLERLGYRSMSYLVGLPAFPGHAGLPAALGSLC